MFKAIESLTLFVVKAVKVVIGLAVALLVLVVGLMIWVGSSRSSLPPVQPYSGAATFSQQVAPPVSPAPAKVESAQRPSPTYQRVSGPVEQPHPERTESVKGYYRNGKWVDGYKRSKPTK